MKHGQTKEIIMLPHSCLTTKAEAIPLPEGLAEATQIIKDLEATLRPRMPAAGLAAPQIGLSKQVFIFSWDRSPQRLEAAINPSFQPLGEEMASGWEGCFSVPLALAKVPRYKAIQATYINQQGKKVRYRLVDFAARVFQHEYDHLQGVENIHKEDALIKEFTDPEGRLEFIQQIRKQDQAHYQKPAPIPE